MIFLGCLYLIKPQLIDLYYSDMVSSSQLKQSCPGYTRYAFEVMIRAGEELKLFCKSFSHDKWSYRAHKWGGGCVPTSQGECVMSQNDF